MGYGEAWACDGWGVKVKAWGCRERPLEGETGVDDEEPRRAITLQTLVKLLRAQGMRRGQRGPHLQGT